jgi:hypothetical protein
MFVEKNYTTRQDIFYILIVFHIFSCQAKLRTSIKGLFKILKHSYYKWTRNRLSSWWSEWVAGVEALKKQRKERNKLKKKVNILYSGHFAR